MSNKIDVDRIKAFQHQIMMLKAAKGRYTLQEEQLIMLSDHIEAQAQELAALQEQYDPELKSQSELVSEVTKLVIDLEDSKREKAALKARCARLETAAQDVIETRYPHYECICSKEAQDEMCEVHGRNASAIEELHSALTPSEDVERSKE